MESIAPKHRNILGFSVVVLGFVVLNLTLMPELETGWLSFIGGIGLIGAGFALLYVLPVKKTQG